MDGSFRKVDLESIEACVVKGLFLTEQSWTFVLSL